MVMPPIQVLQSIFDMWPEPLFVLGPTHECLYANFAFRSLIGQKNAAVVATRDFWPSLAAEEIAPGECSCHLFMGGVSTPAKVHIQELPGGNTLVRLIAWLSGGDAALHLHGQRLETLGMLAGGVAHDFNNVLTGILGHITYLKTILPASGPHIESLSAIQDGAKKASSLSQQILNFSKLEDAETSEEVDLTSLVRKTCSLLRGAMNPATKLAVHVPTDSVVTIGAEGRLAQIVVNLVVNARDAVSDAGRVDVVLDVVSDENELGHAFGGVELPCASYARLTVRDTGHGMTPEILKRIFEPYFSTKKRHGTGLGLATVRSIVQEGGGAIVVNSAVGAGTEVKVYLPRVEPQAIARVQSSEAAALVQAGEGRILVVDDEYAVRNVLAVSLQHLGYTVETAGSGKEALELFSASTPPFDLVILDMLMPHLSGEKTFFELQALDPQVRVLLISGYTSREAVQNVLQAGGLGFIQKPFTIEDLSQHVRRCFPSGCGPVSPPAGPETLRRG